MSEPKMDSYAMENAMRVAMLGDSLYTAKAKRRMAPLYAEEWAAKARRLRAQAISLRVRADELNAEAAVDDGQAMEWLAVAELPPLTIEESAGDGDGTTERVGPVTSEQTASLARWLEQLVHQGYHTVVLRPNTIDCGHDDETDPPVSLYRIDTILAALKQVGP